MPYKDSVESSLPRTLQASSLSALVLSTVRGSKGTSLFSLRRHPHSLGTHGCLMGDPLSNGRKALPIRHGLRGERAWFVKEINLTGTAGLGEERQKSTFKFKEKMHYTQNFICESLRRAHQAAPAPFWPAPCLYGDSISARQNHTCSEPREALKLTQLFPVLSSLNCYNLYGSNLCEVPWHVLLGLGAIGIISYLLYFPSR